MAPRALVSRIDRWELCASPKASCRSVADFAWEVTRQKSRRLPIRASVLVIRNPYRRLISAYLNKYVEHSKYRQASLGRCPTARLDCFADFVDELTQHRFRCIDKVHFKPQLSRYRWRRFDLVFNAEDLEPLALLVNSLWGTSVVMPFRAAADRDPVVRGLTAGASAAGSEAGWEGGMEGGMEAGWEGAQEPLPLARRPHRQLAALLAEDRCPPYADFFDADLMARCRRIYHLDFAFLEAARRRGLLDPALHEQLTTL